ncbi:MAG: DNA topoisomerase VI subunit B [Methanotrichaceae archaeon]|nr:DNA topoisomerase VI subunit B [Methanotrichaceae archaeon]
MEIAEELAKQQRAISVAEFFEKNRQILGFDSAPRSIITCVKEAVDNSLDACEDAGILPDIFVQIKRKGDYFQVIVEDNGPGIIAEEIPRVFAKMLYGSRFHTLRQSRGQQGIGISAAVLYGQLTSGKPAKVISKIGPNRPALYYELIINTAKNEPEILHKGEINWDQPRGTRIELEMGGSYVRSRRQSVFGYLKNVAIVNPHTRITLVEPDGNTELFERATETLPKKAYAIQPHPSGIELGELIRLLRYTERKKLGVFLKETFSSIGSIATQEICKLADLEPDRSPQSINHEEAKRILAAFKNIKVKSPPIDCLSPIGEDLIKASLEKEFKLDFVATATRPVSVFSGNPFLVEVGLGYGGELDKEGRIDIIRFANRVPLIYQQGACAITHAAESIPWKNYSLAHSNSLGLPTGPAVLMVHIASTNIPFTSESKDAIADLPDILSEIELALKEVGRKLRRYLARQSVLSERSEKEEIIRKILPSIAKKLSEILGENEPDISSVVAKIMGNLLIKRVVDQKDGLLSVKIDIENHSELIRSFKLHEVLSQGASSVMPEAKLIPMSDGYDHYWKLSLSPNEQQLITYQVRLGTKFSEIVIEGIEPEVVTGARVI